jgi:hypothetical protein
MKTLTTILTIAILSLSSINAVASDNQEPVYSNFNEATASNNIITVELFTALLNAQGQKIELKWTTTNETNMSHFIVERSTDGKNFTNAALVFAYGNTSGAMTYKFSDKVASSTSGTMHYRFFSVDNKGKAQLSETRTILFNDTAKCF